MNSEDKTPDMPDENEKTGVSDTDPNEYNSRRIIEKRDAAERRSKIIAMIVSLVIACGLWMYVVDAVNPVTTRSFSDVRIEVINENSLEKNELRLTQYEPGTVKVTLRGHRSTLMDLDAEDIHATVNVSDCTAGENYVNVKVNAPSNTSVDNIGESQVKLNVENVITEGKDVRIKFSGKARDGYQAVAVRQDLETVNVTGVSSAVKKVKEVTASVNATDLSSDLFRADAELTAVDENGKTVKGVELSRKTVRAYVQLYKIKTVKLRTSQTGSLPAGLELAGFKAPPSIKVAVEPELEDSIVAVAADPVDLSKISKSGSVKLELELPSGVELADGQDEPKADVKVSKLTSQVMECNTDSIRIKNLSEDLEMKFASKTVKVSLSGTASVLSSISEDDISITADASSVTEGDTSVPLTVRITGRAGDSGATASADPAEIEVKPKESSESAQ